ncbi:hypothetical protein TNCV_601141 [Trichonephila clavipes]|nr:hypothetical protein TNCV_601141 [Trichonephila clavipes]
MRTFLQRYTNFSLESPGSPRINEDEGGLMTKEFLISDSTLEIEQASSHKLGVELRNRENFLYRNLVNCGHFDTSNVQDMSRKYHLN